MVAPFIMLAKVMDLCVAVMARGNTIICLSILDLIKFQLSVMMPGVSKPRLQITAPATTAVIVGSVGMHINEILFTHNRFDNEPQVFCNRITKGLSHQLAGVLNRELHLQILVPIRVDFQFSFPDPFGITLNNRYDFKLVRNIEFLQSGPDCEEFVASFRVKPILTP
jgi:hypothetical protein